MTTHQKSMAQELGILSLIFALSPLIDALLVPAAAQADPRLLLGGNLIRLGGLTLCFYLLTRRRQGRQFLQAALGFKTETLILGLGGIGGVYIVVIGLSLLLNALGLTVPNELTAELGAERFEPWLAGGLVLSVMLAGFFEEAFWRVYALRRLEELGWVPSLAVAVTSVVFGLAHAYQGRSALIVSIVIAVCLSLLWYWRRNYWIIAIAHAGYNASVLLLLLRH